MKEAIITLLAFAAIFAILAADHFGLGQSAEEQAGCIPAATGGYVYRSPETGALLKCSKE